MSYILDALVKSEQARLRGTAARHSLLPAVGDAPPPQRSRHYLLLAGLLALNAAVLYPRLHPTPSAPAPAPRLETAAKPIARPGTAPPQVATAPAPRRPAVRPEPLRRTTDASPPPSAGAETRVVTNEAPAPAANALPQLPPLAVAGYIRNPGAPDMVIVNDKLLREGDEVEPGLRLEKILGDGLVFNYQGYRFKR